VLFAALSYAITKESGGSANVLTTQQARLIGDELIEYGSSLRPIADRMLLSGLSDNNTPSGTGLFYDAPSAETQPAVQELFDINGGNAPYITPPAQACNSTCAYVFSGQYTFTGVGSGANPELSMLLVDIPQTLCQAINIISGLGSTIPTGGALSSAVAFTGSNYGAAPAISLATSARALCYQESSGSHRYIYVNVIRAR
jgi:hypothetical protein